MDIFNSYVKLPEGSGMFHQLDIILGFVSKLGILRLIRQVAFVLPADIICKDINIYIYIYIHYVYTYTPHMCMYIYMYVCMYIYIYLQSHNIMHLYCEVSVTASNII